MGGKISVDEYMASYGATSEALPEETPPPVLAIAQDKPAKAADKLSADEYMADYYKASDAAGVSPAIAPEIHLAEQEVAPPGILGRGKEAVADFFRPSFAPEPTAPVGMEGMPESAIPAGMPENISARRNEINTRLGQLEAETSARNIENLQAQLEEITSQAVDGVLSPDLYNQYTALRPQYEQAVESYNAGTAEAQGLKGELEDLKQMEYGAEMARPVSTITGEPVPTPEEVAAGGRAAMAVIPHGFASAVRGIVPPALERAVMDPITKAVIGKEYVSPIDEALKIGKYLPKKAQATIGIPAHTVGAVAPVSLSFKAAGAIMKVARLPLDLVLKIGSVMDRIVGHIARGGIAGAIYGGLEAGTPKGMAEDAAFFGALEGGLGAVGGIFRKIFSANWYRNLEVSERGLVVQTTEDLLNAGHSEATILRTLSDPVERTRFFEEALARRTASERPTQKDIVKEAIREEMIRAPEAPVPAIPEKPIPLVPPGMPPPVGPPPPAGPPPSALPPGQGFGLIEPATEARLRPAPPTYPPGAEYVAGKPAPEELEVEYKPILGAHGLPWKTETGALKAFKSKRLQDQGITRATHKVVKVKKGYGIASIKDRRPLVTAKAKPEEVKGKTLIAFVRAMGGIRDKTLPGELRALSGKETGVVGLTSSTPDKGLGFDEMASAAVEHGWLPKGLEDKSGTFAEMLRDDIFAQKEGRQRVERLADVAERTEREERWKEFERSEDEELEYFAKHPDEEIDADLDEWQREAIAEIRSRNEADAARKIEESVKSEIEAENPDLGRLKKDEGFTEFIENWNEEDLLDEETLAELEAWRAGEKAEEPVELVEVKAETEKPVKPKEAAEKEAAGEGEFSLLDRETYKPNEELVEYDYDQQKYVTGEEARQAKIKARKDSIKILKSDKAKHFIASQPSPQNKYTVKQALQNETAELSDLESMGVLKGNKVPAGWKSSVKVAPKEKGILPELKNTEDALDFGKTATPEQIKALKAKRDESLSKTETLKNKGDLQGAMDEAARGQFFREAVEVAEGKAARPPMPQKTKPKKQPWEMSKKEYEASPYVEDKSYDLAVEIWRDEGREIAPAYGKKPWEMSLPELTEALEDGLRPPVGKMTGKGMIADFDKYGRNKAQHIWIIKNAVTAGKLTPERYAELHEKDYGPLAEFMPEVAEKSKPKAAPKEKEPWENSALADRPNLSIGYVTAKKQPNGKYKLFFTGTGNEVFAGEEFKSAPEARQFFKVQQVKAQEALAELGAWRAGEKAEEPVEPKKKEPTLKEPEAKYSAAEPVRVERPIFKTGKPVTFNYLKNLEPAPDMGERFGQHIEPAGNYVTHDELADGYLVGKFPEKYKAGKMTFKNPLVIPVSEALEHKKILHKRYNKTGLALSRAIVEEGYDGVVSLDKDGNPGEIIDLRAIKPVPAKEPTLREPESEYSVAEGRVTDNPNFVKWFGDSKVVDEKGKPLVVYHGTPFGNFDTSAKSINEARKKLIAKHKKILADRLEVYEMFDWNSPQADQDAGRKLIEELEEEEAKLPVHAFYQREEGDVFRYTGTNDYGYLGRGFYFTADKKVAQVWAKYAARSRVAGEKKEPYIYETYVKIENPFRHNVDKYTAEMASTEQRNYKNLTRYERDVDKLLAARSRAQTQMLQKFGYDGVIGETAGDQGTEFLVFDSTQVKSVSNAGAFNPTEADIFKEPEAKYSVAESEPYMYSALTRAAESPKFPEKLFAKSVINRLKKAPGVKQAEIDTLGLAEWLGGKGKITKAELVDFLKMNEVTVEEVEKGVPPDIPSDREVSEAADRVSELSHKLMFDLEPGTEEYKKALSEKLKAEAVVMEAVHGADADEDTKHAEYVLPGGEPGSYREVVLRVPSTYQVADKEYSDFVAKIKRKYNEENPYDARDQGLLSGGEKAELEALEKKFQDVIEYRSTHWPDDLNVIAHIRGDARTDADGKRRFHVAEFQSDIYSQIVELEGAIREREAKYGKISQEERKRIDELKEKDQNFTASREEQLELNELVRKTTTADQIELANLKKLFPWGENWHELVAKKALEYAIKNNFSGISWDTGKTQVDRWESALRKSVDKIEWTKSHEGLKRSSPQVVDIGGFKDGERVFSERVLAKGETKIRDQRVTLNNLIGKELATKIRESSETSGNFEGKNLTLSGEFYKIIYDQKIPGFLKKYGKKWGAAVLESKIDDNPIHTMDITPAMRQAIQTQGQAIMEPTGRYEQSELDIAFGGKKKAYEAIESVAKRVEAVSVSRRRVPDRVAGREVPTSKIAEELRKKSRVDLAGRKLTEGNESQEIAELFQVYRSPKMEILHAIYTAKDGTILGHRPVTSGDLGSVRPGKTLIRYLVGIDSAARRLDAAKVHFLHNHPTGNVRMSKADILIGNAISNYFEDRMGEFVVINHGKHSFIKRGVIGGGKTSREIRNAFSWGLQISDLTDEGTFKVLPGTGEWMAKKGPALTSPQAAAAFGRSLAYDKTKVCFVYVDSGNNVVGWSTHDKSILKKENLREIVKQQAKGHDAEIAVILTQDIKDVKPVVLRAKSGVGDWLLDALDATGCSIREAFPRSFEGRRGSKPAKPAWGLFEPEAGYGEGREVIAQDGTTVDWNKSMILLKQRVFGTYKKDGSFDKWRTRGEINITKAFKKAKTKHREQLGRAKERFDVRVEKIKTAKDILLGRRKKIRAIKEYFLLSDSDLRKITRKDIRLMSDYEFKKFIDDIRIKAEKFAERRQAMNELQLQIKEKELKVENLRKAMRLPPLKKMTVEHIRALDEALKPFQKGDVFLSLRKLETVDRTELKGIKTWREARERLAEKLGVSVERLQSIKVVEFDRFRYDTGLAERNPFYKMMVEETAKRMLISEAEYLQMEKDVFAIAKKLRPKGIIAGRLIPQQKKVRAFMEAPAGQKSDIDLTKEELALAEYMTKHFARAREYLVQIEAMNMGRENYFTHVRRGPLEAIKEDGIIRAVKEMFEMYKLDEQGFNILDRSTGEILALDKFFKFAMHRVDKIKPTENVVRAFLVYMKTFKKKQALDEIVPLIDIYAHSLTPKGLTKKGLFLDANLIKFTREWLNTQKGRHITLIAKQNGKIDAALRAIKMFTSLRDLGLNIPVSVATEIGEQITTYQLLGKKSFALGKIRQNTKQGKVIIEKYRSLIGKNPWAELVEPSKEIGDRLMEGIFVMFRDASTRANKTFLLGSLSKKEFEAGEISPERLASLQIELGRYRMVRGASSIVGATPEGKAYTQYKKWAIPILRTTIKNLGNLGKKITFQKVGSEDFKKSALELYRLVEVTAFAMVIFGMVRDEDDESFAGKIINKAYREATTLIQALQPRMFMAAGRTASFIEELGVNLTLLLKGEEYKTTGKLKGAEKLKRQVTPVAISQFKGKKKPEPRPKMKKSRLTGGLAGGLGGHLNR